ncbi:MAG: hypothetical protein J7501_06020 [Bdellovibrio sp.]|nr:hypothetical protein [Bdellovibrio sp.]
MMTSPAWAYLTSDWDVSLGMSSLKYYFGRLEDSKTLESSTTIEVNYSINNPSINTAFTMSFMEMTEADGMQLPFTRLSFGARYYLFGVNGMRTILDSRTQAKVWRATPFIAANLGLSNLAVEKLNASLMDISLRGGVEIPMMSNLLLVGQVALGSSLTSAGDQEDSIRYELLTLFAGIRFVGFE